MRDIEHNRLRVIAVFVLFRLLRTPYIVSISIFPRCRQVYVCKHVLVFSLEVILRKASVEGEKEKKNRSASLSAVLQPLGVYYCFTVSAYAPTAGAPPSGQT